MKATFKRIDGTTFETTIPSEEELTSYPFVEFEGDTYHVVDCTFFDYSDEPYVLGRVRRCRPRLN